MQHPVTVTMSVGGMTCASCEHHVTRALEQAGAAQVTASWRRGEASFTWPGGAPDGVTEEGLRAAIEQAGYTPRQLRVVAAARPDPTGPQPGPGATGYDLLILGAGSAAFAAAITAREAGAELRQAKYADLVDAYGFEVIAGQARFTGPTSVTVGGREVSAGAVLVASGASPAVPPIPGLAEAGFLTSTSALDLKEIPRRLVVIGSSAVGLELGQFFLHVGSQVTFVDVADRIAPLEEPEATAALTEVLTGQGATVHAPAQVLAVERDGEARRVHLRVDGARRSIDADAVLVATGRRPNTAALDLPAAGVAVDSHSAVVVDEQLRTSNPRVWAAGDVTGAPQFVYVAAAHGALAADNALHGAGRTVDDTGLPRVTFTAPQLAGAGLTEQAARAAGYQVHTAVLPLAVVPRALVNRDTRGLVKLVADQPSGRLLGATVAADGAGDVIQASVLAIRAGLTTGELAGTFHPYLTMAEALKLAAQTFTRDVERLSCCAA